MEKSVGVRMRVEQLEQVAGGESCLLGRLGIGGERLGLRSQGGFGLGPGRRGGEIELARPSGRA